MTTKKPKKEKKPFWKKLPPELQRVADHIGKSIDNGHILDYIAAGICAYAGYHAGEEMQQPIEVKAGLAASGLIAYQLSKSMNLVAGASGVAYLASLGLISAWNPMRQGAQEAWQQFAETIGQPEVKPKEMLFPPLNMPWLRLVRP